MAKKRKRPNRSAAERREQYDRAHAKVAQTLTKGLTALDHHGCRRTKLGDALLLLLSTQDAQADHGAEDSSLYAASQPWWPWQWHWPQADVPWPEEPIWHPEQVPLEVPEHANSSTPLAAAHTRDALGPAAEDLETNWSFSCTSAAQDGWFSHRSSTSSHENSAVPTPTTQSPPAPLGKTEVRDREEAEATTTALTTSVAVQPVSLSTPSPSLAKVATKAPVPGKAVEDRTGAEATTTALTSSVAVQQVRPSTMPFSLAKDVATKPQTFRLLGDCSTADEVSQYIESVVARRSEWAERNRGVPEPECFEELLRIAANHQETLRLREAREALATRRSAQLQLDADRPEHRSATYSGAG